MQEERGESRETKSKFSQMRRSSMDEQRTKKASLIAPSKATKADYLTRLTNVHSTINKKEAR
jgi:hypothetical protein